ncbi:MAG: hypothetical protein IPG09_13100 [Ignavibacteria bacterium]|nr:hypothetical protein [Ignavibacteria bacterium]
MTEVRIFSVKILIEKDGTSRAVKKKILFLKSQITGQVAPGEKYPSGWRMKIPSMNMI